MDRRANEQTNERMNEWRTVGIDERTNERADERTSYRKNGLTDGWMNERKAN